MSRFMLILALLPTPLLAQKPPEAKRQESEIVRPEDYSVRRFQEVIDSAVKGAPKTAQEELIALRAKLIISERRWAELKEMRSENNPEAEKRNLTRTETLRAAQAEMNHYQLKIARLEEKILRLRRKAKTHEGTLHPKLKTRNK